MDSNLSTVPILVSDLAEYQDRSNRLLMSVKWLPKPFAEARPSTTPGTIAWRPEASPQLQVEELSLVGVLRKTARDSLLFPEGINHALTALRQGLSIGMHLSKLYTKFSGLDQLVQLNSRGGLAELQKVEFRNKCQTAAAVAVFGSASYVLWELSQYRQEELSSVAIEIPSIPELSLQDPVRSLDCFVYYLAAISAKAEIVNGEMTFVKAALLYAQQTAVEIVRRADSFEQSEAFRAQVYQLERSNFRVDGFKLEPAANRSSVEFNRVRLEEIVGNREAKHQAKRLVSRLLCYDPITKKNPMHELGGLPAVTMGFGDPGTGKSLLIAAVATMLEEQCSVLGIPFLFWPLPDTVVSTYQGGSAERMMSWMNALKDPTKIVYAPIDDAENNLEDRSRQGVSAGVREVVAVFLRHTEGAYAIHRGNALIQLFTNLPDQVDKAVLSRISDRMPISGAVTHDDFLDQDYLWYRKYSAHDSSFVNQQLPRDYELLSAQASFHERVRKSVRKPLDSRMARIFEKVSSRHCPSTQEFFAELFFAVKECFPRFTSRDVRNIQRAVDGRVLDFDFPQAWFDQPDLFFRLSYNEKKAMIITEMKRNMKELSFADIRLEETVRYLDAIAAIEDTGRERLISERVQQLELESEARSRFSGRAA